MLKWPFACVPIHFPSEFHSLIQNERTQSYRFVEENEIEQELTSGWYIYIYATKIWMILTWHKHRQVPFKYQIDVGCAVQSYINVDSAIVDWLDDNVSHISISRFPISNMRLHSASIVCVWNQDCDSTLFACHNSLSSVHFPNYNIHMNSWMPFNRP